MKPKWLTIGSMLKLGAVMGAGALAGFTVPPASFGEATTVLASFAGVVVAALVPTMILAATILRPVSKGKKEFARVRGAVATQISFFSGLFLLTVILAALLFVGSLMGWSDIKVPLSLPAGPYSLSFSVPVTKIIGGTVVGLATLIAIQMTGFVHGIRSLFALHADNAERELDRLIADQNAAVTKALLPKDPRTRIGESIGELKH